MTTKPKRNYTTRWEDVLVPKNVRYTWRDPIRLDIVYRYKFIPARFIRRLQPERLKTKDPSTFRVSMTRLRRLRLVKVVMTYNDNRDLIYEITAKGKRFLDGRGKLFSFQRSYANFFHDMFASLTVAGLEIQTIDNPDLTFHPWTELQQLPFVPENTLNLKQPHMIDASIDDGKPIKIIADYPPFCISHINKKKLFFMGVESDMGTEPESPTAFRSRPNIKKKLMAWLDVIKQDRAKSHYGFPNMRIIFVASSRERRDQMMKLLSELTTGKGSSRILFGYSVDLRTLPRTPYIQDFTEIEWKRVGHPDFNLVEHFEK